MFPYCSTIYFITALVGFAISLKLFLVWRQKKDENIGYIFKAIAIATIFYLLSSLPGIFVKNYFLISLFYLLAWIPHYLSIFYLTKLSFNFWNLKKAKSILLAVFIFLIIFVTFFNIVYFSNPTIKRYKDLTFCFASSPSWVLNFSGMVTFLFLLANSILFLRGGIMSREKFTRVRGLTIGVGLFLITLAALFNYIIAPYWQDTKIFLFFAGPLLLLGVLMVYFGVQHKRKENIG